MEDLSLKQRIEVSKSHPSMSDFFTLVQSGNQNRVNEVVTFNQETKALFEKEYDAFVKNKKNITFLESCSSVLDALNRQTEKSDCLKLAFGIYVSDDYGSLQKIVGNCLDWNISFDQFISEYVDWNVLSKEFGHIPELEVFLENRHSLYAYINSDQEREYVPVVSKIIFKQLQSKFGVR